MPEFLQSAFTAASDPSTADLLRGLMTEAQERPDFGIRFRHDFLGPRRAAFQIMIDRAIARNDLPSHVPSEAIADIAFASLWYRLLATREPLDTRYADAVTRTLARLRYLKEPDPRPARRRPTDSVSEPCSKTSHCPAAET